MLRNTVRVYARWVVWCARSTKREPDGVATVTYEFCTEMTRRHAALEYSACDLCDLVTNILLQFFDFYFKFHPSPSMKRKFSRSLAGSTVPKLRAGSYS